MRKIRIRAKVLMMKMSVRLAVVGLVLAMTGAAVAADQFVKPTKEELEMKSLPGYPGAAAVVLFREQITKDDLHVVYHYDRIKVLTEEGKRYANVELRFISSTDTGSWDDVVDNKTVGEIVGRTIHADGTVIPFTGKPYKKVMEQGEGFKRQAMIFTLPDVEVGSILEYKYTTRIEDHVFESPNWFIQDALYVRSAHYGWLPTTRELIDSEQRPINAISWFPILPAGAKIERHEIPGAGPNGSNQQTYDLLVKDIPPQAREEHMPPIASFSYRVLFSFTSFRSADEFWKSAGKQWSKRVDNFASQNGALQSATQAVTAGAATPEEKLKKIYAAVMTVENTDYTRSRSRNEDKAAGLGKVNNVADVWERKRGSSTQINELFVAMARAAGLKAYAMLVPDRSERLFTPSWLNMGQFDEEIAVVNVDGKDKFFDPGERYCQYGAVAWQHSEVQGLRQVDGGTGFAMVPGAPYTSNKTTRVANLNMDEKGEIKGTIDVTFSGSPALQWRHTALRGDEESLHRSLKTFLEREVPESLDLKVASVKNADDYEKPLMVTYDVKGTLGSSTGKRMLLPADLFAARSTATFPHEKRELAVYFHYPQMVQDAQRINFPATWMVEAAPEDSALKMGGRAVYDMKVKSDAKGFTTRRNYLFGEILVPSEKYAELRTFYTQFESKDKESVVLKPAVATASATVGN